MQYFVDEDLDGPRFVSPLRDAGIEVVRHRELFPKGVADIEWIPAVTEQGLVILSGNTRMRYNPIEVETIQRTGAQVLYVHRHDKLTQPMLAELFVQSRKQVEEFFAVTSRPRVGVLARPSHAGGQDGAQPGRIVVPRAFSAA